MHANISKHLNAYKFIIINTL